MGCCSNIDYTIFKDKIIVLAFIFIIMLSILLVSMIKSDISILPITNNSTEINHNHTKTITTWTIQPLEGIYDCRLYDSAGGGSSPNGSSYGSCSKCNCTSVSIRDI